MYHRGVLALLAADLCNERSALVCTRFLQAVVLDLGSGQCRLAGVSCCFACSFALMQRGHGCCALGELVCNAQKRSTAAPVSLMRCTWSPKTYAVQIAVTSAQQRVPQAAGRGPGCPRSSCRSRPPPSHVLLSVSPCHPPRTGSTWTAVLAAAGCGPCVWLTLRRSPQLQVQTRHTHTRAVPQTPARQHQSTLSRTACVDFYGSCAAILHRRQLGRHLVHDGAQGTCTILICAITAHRQYEVRRTTLHASSSNRF